MKTIVPDFYLQFACKADKCQHTCCAGWQIDIDAVTYAKYQQLPGKLGADLRRDTYKDEQGAHFRMREDGRCPFLREDGFCRVIREAGEDYLGNICAMHPRFFGYYNGFELAGTGLSCEKTCELLLQSNDELKFLLLDDLPAKDKKLTFNGKEDAIKRMNIAELLDCLDLSVAAEEVHYAPQLTHEDASFVLDAMKQTYPIDEQWTKLLQRIEGQLPHLPATITVAAEDLPLYKRIFAYVLYRQLDNVETYGLPDVLSFAYCNADFIALSAIVTGDLAESLRYWSEQIEYDTENVALLYALL